MKSEECRTRVTGGSVSRLSRRRSEGGGDGVDRPLEQEREREERASSKIENKTKKFNYWII